MLEEKVREIIAGHGLLTPHMRVVVGFSAGVDSVCLLHLLKNLTDYDLELWALYVNHELRPAENVREIELLQQIGAEWDIRTQEIKIDIPGKLAQKPQSLQLLARFERYRAFETFSREIGAARLALAHHQDDQAETVFYRIIRGTGLDGLAGMPVIRDGLYIRPLLGVTRKEILQYVAEHHLTWVEDSSNHKLIYTRNRLRHQLLPEIEANYNPRFKNSLLRLAGLAREQHEFMECILANLKEELISSGTGGIGIRLAVLLEQHPFVQYYLLKEMLAGMQPYYQVESRQLQQLRDRLNREREQFKQVQLAREVTVVVKAGIVFMTKPASGTAGPKSDITVAAPGETRLTDWRLQLMVRPVETLPEWQQVGKGEVYIDAQTVTLPLKVRSWRPGDAFQPLGVAGTQKLHDFFINQKIPRNERSAVPLLVDGDDRIVWVIGHRLSAVFKVAAKTSQVWQISAAEY